MGNQDSSQEKTEDATPKKLREARKKGQIAKSKDLSTVAVMVVVFVTIAFTTGTITSELKMAMATIFEKVSQGTFDGADMMDAGRLAFFSFTKVMVPILVAGVVTAVVVGFLQVGAIFSTEVLTPKLEKLNPIEGVKNMFKMATFIELLKNVAKLTLVVYLAYRTINNYMQEILLSPQVGVVESVSMTGDIVYSFFVKVAILFLIIAIIDMGVQRWNFMKNMRMSKDEVKREYKQDEGDPHIKQERRRLHREMVFGDVKKNVKKADAVVSNPIHVAVAIQYDRKEMGAPEVLAKGQRKYAEMILEIARSENIPVVRNIPLAWALLQVEEGDAIPEDLYEPVAEVLSFVYDLRERASSYEQDAAQPAKEEKKPGPSNFDPLG